MILAPCIDHDQRGDADGYGKLNGMRAHRYVYQQAYGHLPQVVRHTCNNPRCINPLHLVGGTHKDNRRDCATEQRYRNGHEKLTREQVDFIKESDVSQSALARQFGVCRNVIWKIKHGQQYQY